MHQYMECGRQVMLQVKDKARTPLLYSLKFLEIIMERGSRRPTEMAIR